MFHYMASHVGKRYTCWASYVHVKGPLWHFSSFFFFSFFSLSLLLLFICHSCFFSCGIDIIYSIVYRINILQTTHKNAVFMRSVNAWTHGWCVRMGKVHCLICWDSRSSCSAYNMWRIFDWHLFGIKWKNNKTRRACL